MPDPKPTYEELAARLTQAEATIAAFRSDQVDAVVGGQHVWLLRLRETENALRRSERHYRELVEGSIQGILILREGTILFANRAAVHIFGYRSPDELVDHDVRLLIAPSEEAGDRQFAEPSSPVRYEWQGRRQDGLHIWIESLVTRVQWDDEPAVLVTLHDITERQRAEQALRKLNESLEHRVAERTALLELLQDITTAANEAAQVEDALQFALERICRHTGWPIGHVYLPAEGSADTWLPAPIWYLTDPERFEAFYQATQDCRFRRGEGLVGRVAASGKPEWVDDVAVDNTFVRKHTAGLADLQIGFAFPILVGRKMVGILEFFSCDATAPDDSLFEAATHIGTQLGRVIERQRALEHSQRQHAALVQSEKLASMGSLLANVAHELNNPLSIVMMHAELLKEETAGSPLAESVEDIIQGAERCENIVRNFLTLARRHAPERVQVEINTIVTGALEFLESPLQKDSIETHLHLADDLPPLWADPHQLHQVLLNLVTNAHQALLETSPPRQLTIRTRVNPARTQVALEVCDTGPGIPPESLAQIFEPFFTTKPPGVGTGLGLPLCKSLVESHRGTLSVDSQPGHGAVFRIDLPIEAGSEAPPKTPGPQEVRAVDKRTILLVDDEARITRALEHLLRRDGHEVDTAANGSLALEKLKERDYDLILSDLRMPELDGPGLYRAVAHSRPHLLHRFAFLTGDTLSPATIAFLEEVQAPRLTKPFTAHEVRKVIRQALLSPGG